MSETAADRVATFVAAFQDGFRPDNILTIAGASTNHQDMSLVAADVAETTGPETRLLHTVAAALAALPEDDEETRPDYTAAEQKAAELDEEALMRLVALFNEAGAVAYRAYSEKRRTRNIAEMRAREEQKA